MKIEERFNRVLAGLSHTGYTTEIEKCEARIFIEELYKQNQKYKEVIDKVIDKLQLLIDIGFDYDGFNQVNSLKTLIDELVGYAKESRNILKEVELMISGASDEELDIAIARADVLLELQPKIDELKKENQELKKQLEEVEFIVGLRQKRNLISKFDKEYDEEDKKKNPNRDYAGIMPDAEEIYRRYYTMKNQQKEFGYYKKYKNLKNKNKRYRRIIRKLKEELGDK